MLEGVRYPDGYRIPAPKRHFANQRGGQERVAGRLFSIPDPLGMRGAAGTFPRSYWRPKQGENLRCVNLSETSLESHSTDDARMEQGRLLGGAGRLALLG